MRAGPYRSSNRQSLLPDSFAGTPYFSQDMSGDVSTFSPKKPARKKAYSRLSGRDGGGARHRVVVNSQTRISRRRNTMDISLGRSHPSIGKRSDCLVHFMGLLESDMVSFHQLEYWLDRGRLVGTAARSQKLCCLFEMLYHGSLV